MAPGLEMSRPGAKCRAIKSYDVELEVRVWVAFEKRNVGKMCKILSEAMV